MTDAPLNPEDKPLIDLSVGDAALDFEAAYDYGVAKARPGMRKYDNDGSQTAAITNEFCPRLSQLLGTPVSNDNICVTTGSSDGFGMILDDLKEKIDRFNYLTGQDLRPVIVMPIPTYGLFTTVAAAKGFQIAAIQRDPKKNWRVDPQTVGQAIDDINNSGQEIVMAYFDSNPNNPCGTIRTPAETKALAKVFAEQQNWYLDNIATFGDRGKQVGSEGRHQLQEALNNFPRGVTIIDDIVYSGTEYDRQAALSSFMSCPETALETRVLAGISKLGLANLRSGLIVADAQAAEAYRGRMKLDIYFPSPIGTHALTYAFSDNEPFRSEREKHLQALADTHQFSGLLMKAMINGIDDVKATARQKEKMAEAVMDARHVDKGEAGRILKNGLKEHKIHVMTDPQAGFFHLIEFPGMKNMFTRHPGNNEVFQIQDQVDFEQAGYREGVRFCAGHYCGFPENQLVFRASFAFPPEEIVEAVGRMENLARGCVKTPQDAEQLPVFAKPLSATPTSL